MRKSLQDLIENTILWKYNLPNTTLKIDRSVHTTGTDYCYTSVSNEDLAKVIYNSIIEYAHKQNSTRGRELESLHTIALTRKLRFNPKLEESASMKFGFFGETILYALLRLYFKADALISKGYFYNPLEKSESKGFDSFHFVENKESIELWFGEVKFFINYSSAIDSVLDKIETNLSDKYLESNLFAILNQRMNFNHSKTRLGTILDELDENPEIIISELLNANKIKLVYPILIIADELKSGYDESIRSAINHIENKHKEKNISLGISFSILFIYIPIGCAKTVKLKVIQWINSKEPLLS